ncbi:MAG: SpoIIE family protein phosphatase [Phycicoccus sp.]
MGACASVGDERRVARILQGVPDALLDSRQPLAVSVLDRDLRFVAVNAAAAEINGLPVEEHLGRLLREVLPAVAGSVETMVHDAIEQGRAIVDHEVESETPRAPGVRRWWRVHWLPLSEAGEVTGIVALFHEVTVEKELQAAKERAERFSEVLRGHASAVVQAALPGDVAAATARSLQDVLGPDALSVGLVEGSWLHLLRLEGAAEQVREVWEHSPLSSSNPMHDAVGADGPVELQGHDLRAGRYPADVVEAMRPFASLIYIPLPDAVGVVAVGFRRQRTLTRSEHDLLRAVADQCGQALIRARLRERDHRRRRRAEAMQDLASLLAAATTRDEMADAIAQHAHLVAGADYAQLGLTDHDRGVIVMSHGKALGRDVADVWTEAPLDAPIPICDVVRTGDALVFNSRQELVTGYPLVREAAEGSGFETVAVVPIVLTDGGCRGSLSMAWTPAGVVDDETVATMREIARRVAVVLVRGDDAQRGHRARRRSELIARVLGALEQERTGQDRIARFLELVVPRIADFATVEEPDGRAPLLGLAHRDAELVPLLRTLREDHRLPAKSANPVARAAAGEPQLLPSTTPALVGEDITDPDVAALMRRLAPRSHIVVPLLRDESAPAGLALLLGLSDPGRRPYSADDLAFVHELAAQAGAAIGAGRRLDHEHDTAVRLQRALLPAALPPHPYAQIGARYEAASEQLEVGGDWYDVLLLPDGRLGVTVGDVVGKGLDAAAAMGQLRTAIVTLAPTRSPAEVLTELDAFIARSGVTHFATMCYGVYDPVTGTLQYASAGHPHMLAVTPDGVARWLDDGNSGPLLGWQPMDRHDAHVDLEPGTLLLAYSDGLVERREESIAAGLARLEAVASAMAGCSAEDACADVLHAMRANHGFTDDVVILAARVARDDTQIQGQDGGSA